MVILGGSAIVTVPSQAAATALGEAFSDVSVDAVVNAQTVSALLPVAEVLGPATLAYLGRSDFQPTSDEPLVDELAVGHPALRKLERSAGDEDAAEAGLAEITSPTFVIRDNGDVVAASGYRLWPLQTAHLSALAAPEWRGQGLGRTVTSRAVAHALGAGLLPQWRARPVESRRVAAALGFRKLGAQLSLKLA